MTRTEELTKLLKNTKNLILHGAPGVGKTFLAFEIAKQMGCTENEICFVQFHPSYDYTDFVEGIRPSNNGQTGFERVDGLFKQFCKTALKKSINSSEEDLKKIICDKIKESNEFVMKGYQYDYTYTLDSEHDDILVFSILRGIIPPPYDKVTIRLSGLVQFMFFDELILPKEDIKENEQVKRYYCDLKEKLLKDVKINDLYKNNDNSFVFIIDEINRGELSKIFGELFFSIDPGYRGMKERSVQTQYQNFVSEDDIFAKGFYVPDNVYIIGTMNDIDRSVESMDLAMHRRFAFEEIEAKDSAEMLDKRELWKNSEVSSLPIDKLKNRMERLNDAIVSEEIGLNPAYQIGAAYFLKYEMYKDESDPFDCLWKYNFKPLLQEYLRGQGDEEEKLDILKAAYDSADTENAENAS